MMLITSMIQMVIPFEQVQVDTNIIREVDLTLSLQYLG